MADLFIFITTSFEEQHFFLNFSEVQFIDILFKVGGFCVLFKKFAKAEITNIFPLCFLLEILQF